METGRFLLAIVLMVAVIVVTNMLFGPEPPVPPAGGVDTVVVEVPAPRSTPEAPAERAPMPPAVTGAVPAGETDTVVVESPLYRYAFETRGSGIVSAQLLRWESFTRNGPVDLVEDTSGALLSYAVQAAGRRIPLETLPFEVVPAGGLVLEPGSGPETLTFRYRDPAGALVVELAYTFRPDDYAIGVSGEVRVAGDDAPYLLLELGPRLAVNEASAAEDLRALSYVVKSERAGIHSVSLNDVDAERVENGPLTWVAVRNKYFVAAAVAGTEEPFGGVIARPARADHAAELTTTLPVGRDGAVDFVLYLGPQEHERLAALGHDLDDVNPIGWRVFRPIIEPLADVITWALVGMHRALSLAYGWVLILFGILVRVLLWPLNSRAMRSQMKNMEIQPRIKEIQERYRNNPEKLQQEMLRLYREEGFNPLGGCLPLLIPFPVLITLFFVFQNTIEFRGVEFLWLPDLSRPDPFYILPIVLGASMFLLQWMSMRTTPSPNPQMKMMLWFMPAFMVIIFLNLAAGLNLYYAASNLASIPQQLQISRERRRYQAARA